VVLARFDGPGLPEPDAENEVTFLAYDPGQDPEDPEPEKPPLSTEKVTEEGTPVEESRSTSSELAAANKPATDARSAADTSTAASSAATTSSPAPAVSEARSLLAFVLVTLLAALAGAVFLVSQRGTIPDRSFEGPSLAAHSRVGSPLNASPATAHPQMRVAPEHSADAGGQH
jgi:hypothetical protein